MTIYSSLAPAIIPEDRPKRIKGTIDVPDVGRATKVWLQFKLRHERPADLRLWLVSPQGQQVLVRERSRLALPEAPVLVPAFAGASIQGRWQLWVDDVKAGHGGVLESWQLQVQTADTPLTIQLAFMGGLTPGQKDVFLAAQERLQRVLVGTRSERLEVIIEAAGVNIDGPGAVLGQAGPTRVRASDGLPLRGVMEFDSADLLGMERDGSLASVLIHEMAHVLGFGTLFGYHQLVASGAYIGAAGVAEYEALGGVGAVPLENDGGPGTAGGHWEEDIFGSELMTGYVNAGHNPFSRVSAGAFADLGYRVDYTQADPYVLGLRRLASSPMRMVWRGCKAPSYEVV